MYSPKCRGLAPLDYHPFLSMGNDFVGETCASRKALKIDCSSLLPIEARVYMRMGLKTYIQNGNKLLKKTVYNGAYLT